MSIIANKPLWPKLKFDSFYVLSSTHQICPTVFRTNYSFFRGVVPLKIQFLCIIKKISENLCILMSWHNKNRPTLKNVSWSTWNKKYLIVGLCKWCYARYLQMFTYQSTYYRVSLHNECHVFYFRKINTSLFVLVFDKSTSGIDILSWRSS
jgi:hypothetical protein